MSATVISKFRERPKTKTAWRAMGLGLGSVLTGPALGINAAIIRPTIERAVGEKSAVAVASGLAVLLLLLPVVALVLGIKAFRKGERSWVLWAGFVPAVLACAFLVFLVVGEFAVPH